MIVRGFAVPERALTVHPEWAFAFTHLGKDVENRTWKLKPEQLPMLALIHAGAHVGGEPSRTALEQGLGALFEHAGAAGWGLEHEVLDPLRKDDGFRVWLRGRNADGRELPRTLVPTRAFVAAVVFDRIDELAPVAVRPGDPWAVGPWAWRASRIVPIADPVKCRTGKLGLWPISAKQFQRLAPALANAVIVEQRPPAQTG